MMLRTKLHIVGDAGKEQDEVLETTAATYPVRPRATSDGMAGRGAIVCAFAFC